MDSSSIKRHRLTELMWKHDPSFCCIQEPYLSNKDRHYYILKGWKKVFHTNSWKKQAWVVILISSTIYFHPELIKGEGGHYIHIRGKIHWDDFSIYKISDPNICKEALIKIKSHIQHHTLIQGDSRTPLSPMNSHQDRK